jgi:hypothetical protein
MSAPINCAPPSSRSDAPAFPSAYAVLIQEHNSKLNELLCFLEQRKVVASDTTIRAANDSGITVFPVEQNVSPPVLPYDRRRICKESEGQSMTLDRAGRTSLVLCALVLVLAAAPLPAQFSRR